MTRGTRAPESNRRLSARRGIGGVLLAAWLLSLSGCDPDARSRFMSIGTAGTGGIYYILGGALANRLNLRDPDRQYTAEVTGGSVENVNRLRAGHIDLGIVMAVTAFEAFHGGDDYPTPVTSLRIIAPLYPNVTHLVLRRGFNIESIADLRGRRVSVGSAGSGTEQAARHLLEAGGLSYGDIQVRYLSFAESSAALQDGAIDAAIISAGYPAAAVLEATTTGGAHLFGLSDAVVEALRARYPYYRPVEIPAGVYRGVTAPVQAVSMMNWIAASEDLPDEVVDRVLEVLTRDRDALIQVHEMARQIDLDDLRDSPIPVHPAVER
jgi:uncharacterized protein